MVLVYATPDDDALASTGLDATTLTARIEAAAAIIRRTTRSAYYATDSTGAPLDADVADGFRRATIAQVITWHLLDVDPAAGPAQVTGTKQSQSLLGGSVTYAVRPGADQDKVNTITGLAPSALDILWDLTQLPGRPFTWTA